MHLSACGGQLFSFSIFKFRYASAYCINELPEFYIILSFKQVLNAAWDCGLTVAGQNRDPCYDRAEHVRIVETSKPRNDPDSRNLSFFVYQRPSPFAQRTYCFSELDYFIKSMHGKNY